jgi:DNA-binding response OmpR family regulator
MVSASVILTVDRNKRNLELLAQFLGKEGYQTHAVTSLDEFKLALDMADQFGLALVDISGFDRGIWEYCEALSDRGIPLLILSPQHMSRIQQESMSHGAMGVLFKPLVIRELTSMIRNIMQD